MNELNEYPEPDVKAAGVAWPEAPASAYSVGSLAGSPGRSHTVDAGIDAVLGRLDEVRGLPVAEHNAVYSDMHDALLEALNEDLTSGSGDA